MSEYESDRWRILTAASMASGAAVVLFQYPLARNIALMIGTIVSNPGDMAKAAKEWQAPAEGEGGMDFEAIRQEIVKLKEAVHEKGYWSGPAWELFSQSADTFAEQVKATETYYKGVGTGVGQVATLYHWAVEVAVWAAAAMTLAAQWQWLSFIVPVWGQVVMRGAINGLLVSLAQVLRSMLGKKLKAVAVLTGILVAVNAMCATMTQLIDKNRPKPDYSPTDLEYVSNDSTGVGNLQQKNGGMPNLSVPGMGGLI
ncbi:MAG: hypothetical protein HOV96_23605 [Nonomuraea sp.]|nr:hypothetical protein [Nonomuraea sp.]NUP64253.1 hypothetical protein [Nonomuraea sp.]NUP80534.1 hypothetical protein [Nonomuraea sp.]NUS08266.1 hypothetical protein [Nonomuraea sp.]